MRSDTGGARGDLEVAAPIGYIIASPGHAAKAAVAFGKIHACSQFHRGAHALRRGNRRCGKIRAVLTKINVMMAVHR